MVLLPEGQTPTIGSTNPQVWWCNSMITIVNHGFTVTPYVKTNPIEAFSSVSIMVPNAVRPGHEPPDQGAI